MSVTASIVGALATYLRTAMPELQKVHEEWPAKNEQLVYPSLTITTAEPHFTRCQPYMLEQGPTVASASLNTYIVGQWELLMQLDIWSQYKPQRADLFEKLFQALQPVSTRALCLQLADYYAQWVTFTMTGSRYADAEASATLQEWRAIISLEATVLAVNSATEPVITQPPVLILETPEIIS